MPNYHYRCTECEDEFEIHQSIKDAPLEHCQECNCLDGLERVIHAAHLFVKAEPKTVGLLAERNTAKMGRYELEDKREAHNQRGKTGRAELPKAPRPWWRKSDKIDTNLAKYGGNVEIKDGKPVKIDPVTPAGLKYIMEGKKT
jgi:putative FmdB family regulatory protein